MVPSSTIQIKHPKRILSFKTETSKTGLLNSHTKLGVMPRATAAPPIPYSSINDQPITQATLHTKSTQNYIPTLN